MNLDFNVLKEFLKLSKMKIYFCKRFHQLTNNFIKFLIFELES